MFIEDEEGRLWNGRQIETIYPAKAEQVGDKKSFSHAVRFKDDTSIRVSAHELKRYYRETAKMTPAEPGVSVIHVDPGTGQVFKTPVVGWVLVQEEGILPVTINGVNDDLDDSQHILFPNDLVLAYGEGTITLAEHIEAEKSRMGKN